MEKHEILKIYGTGYREMTVRLLEEADLASLLPPDRGCCIGIKPNLVSPTPACLGATTHPEVVAGILEYLQRYGYRNLVIAEGSWVGDETQEAVSVCGYDSLCAEFGAEFLDTQKDRSFEKDCSGMKLKLCSCTERFDFLINVPVLKGHCQTRITCALKNLKGLIPNAEKRRFHRLGLHEPIAHLNAAVRQDFIVVDHICGDLDFEDGGNPVICNCIMAARDPVLVDAYACSLLSRDVSEVPYIGLAARLGVGNMDAAHACVRILQDMDPGAGTEQDSSPKTGAKASGNPEEGLLAGRRTVELRDAVSEVESCSACYGSLIPALERLREEGLFGLLTEKICIGQGYQGKTGKLGIGRCTAGFQKSLKGCPPTEEEIYLFLKEYLDR